MRRMFDAANGSRAGTPDASTSDTTKALRKFRDDGSGFTSVLRGAVFRRDRRRKEVSSVEGRDYKRLPLPKATTMIALFPASAVERAADLVDRRFDPVEAFLDGGHRLGLAAVGAAAIRLFRAERLVTRLEHPQAVALFRDEATEESARLRIDRRVVEHPA